MLVRPKQSQGRYSTKSQARKEELSFVQEFRYLGYIMTADYRDDEDIGKQLHSSGVKMVLVICWSESSHLHLLR